MSERDWDREPDPESGVGDPISDAVRGAEFESDPELPDPLVPCGRCHRHAAMYRGAGDDYTCGYCGPRASIFVRPMEARHVAMQERADEALRATGVDLLGTDTPQVWSGDDT